MEYVIIVSIFWLVGNDIGEYFFKLNKIFVEVRVYFKFICFWLMFEFFCKIVVCFVLVESLFIFMVVDILYIYGMKFFFVDIVVFVL